MAMFMRVVVGVFSPWSKVEIVWFGRGPDAGKVAGEENGKAFCEEIGSYPCLMAEIVTCQRRFVELDVRCC